VVDAGLQRGAAIAASAHWTARAAISQAAERWWTAGRRAPGLLTPGGCPVPARPASGPVNQPFGVVDAVKLTGRKVLGRRECGAGIRGWHRDLRC